MAEYGAHITVTSQKTPSIFEVVAQETLLDSIQPAFKHLLKVLAEKNPSKFGTMHIFADEIFFTINTLLQYHYLTNYGASLAENFYDLKRDLIFKKLESSESVKPLSLPPNIVVKSLLTLTVVPYVRGCLDKKFYCIQEERDSQCSNSQSSLKENIKSVFVFLWPKFQLTMDLMCLIYYLRFLTGKQTVHSPFLHLCQVRLSRLSEEDTEYIEEYSNGLSYSKIRSWRQLAMWMTESVGWCLQNSLEVGAFFLQFLDWFYSSNSANKTFFGTSPPPPPPPAIEPRGLERGKCPICLKDRKNETVLTVSGFVFCYACILLHIRERGNCPITNYPATTKQLIRIYHD